MQTIFLFFVIFNYITGALRNTPARFFRRRPKINSLEKLSADREHRGCVGNRTFATDATRKHSLSGIIFARRTICASLVKRGPEGIHPLTQILESSSIETLLPPSEQSQKFRRENLEIPSLLP